jgi:hypothetical protein
LGKSEVLNFIRESILKKDFFHANAIHEKCQFFTFWSKKLLAYAKFNPSKFRLSSKAKKFFVRTIYFPQKGIQDYCRRLLTKDPKL